MRRASTFLLLLALGCGDEAPASVPDAGPASAPAPEAPIATPAPAPREPIDEAPEAPPLDDGSPVVTIPAGTVLVGSRSGSVGRNATAEADLVAVELPAFSIDRRPYPNDPDRPPMTNVDRRQATQLCEAEGKRLCIDIINEVKEIAGVSGIHVMAYRQEEFVAEIVHDSGVLKGRKPWRKEPNFANEMAEARLEESEATAGISPHNLAGAAAENEG